MSGPKPLRSEKVVEAVRSGRLAESVLGFLMDMPLLGVLHFQESLLPMPADDLVDSLLAQAHAL